MLKRITKTVIVLAMLVVTPTWGQVHKANQSKGRTKSQIVKKDSRWEFKDDFYEGLARVRTSEGKWGYGNNIRLLFTDCNIVDVGYMFDEHIPYVLSFVHRHLSPVGVEGYMLLWEVSELLVKILRHETSKID